MSTNEDQVCYMKGSLQMNNLFFISQDKLLGILLSCSFLIFFLFLLTFEPYPYRLNLKSKSGMVSDILLSYQKKMNEERSDRRLNQPPTPGLQIKNVQTVSSKLKNVKYLTVLMVPVFLRAYLTQLVSVSAGEENIKARLTIYMTIPNKLPKGIIKHQKQSGTNVEYENKLRDFLINNLSLQCGDEHIDVANPENQGNLQDRQAPSDSSHWRKKMAEVKKQNEENEQIEESSQESDNDEAYNESFYVADKSRPHGNKYTTWVIEGVFNCDYELENTFFPCMTIKSGLKIIIHNQIYKKIKIEYSFMNCLAENKLGIKVFDFKLNQKVHKTFGIYTLNLNSTSCSLEKAQQNKEQFKNQQLRFREEEEDNNTEENDLRASVKKQKKQKREKAAQFGFEVLSFNLPFILRYQIPIWTLCFASIMLYFTNAQSLSNIFANIILVSVSQISLFSSFRMGKFKTERISMYQISLSLSLIASLLLLIDSTDNFQNLTLQQQVVGPKPNFNAWTNFFFAAIIICGAALLFNIAALVCIGLKTKSLTFNKHLERNHRLSMTWNEDIFKYFFWKKKPDEKRKC